MFVKILAYVAIAAAAALLLLAILTCVILWQKNGVRRNVDNIFENALKENKS